MITTWRSYGSGSAGDALSTEICRSMQTPGELLDVPRSIQSIASLELVLIDF